MRDPNGVTRRNRCAGAQREGDIAVYLAVKRCRRAYRRTLLYSQPRTDATMNMTLNLAPIVSLIAGILILIVPRMLNYIVAIYLIVIGLLGLFGTGNFHLN
jgi:hypothetical protein